jgi:hypothetical protein
MLPSKSVSATPGIIGPVQRAELQLNEYARPVARSLFSFRKLLPAFFRFPLSLFPSIKIRRFICKKDRAAFAGGPSQGGNALGGQQQRGAIADLVLQIKKPRALTGLNLCSRFFCSRYIHAVDASYRDADHVGGRPHDSRIN